MECWTYGGGLAKKASFITQCRGMYMTIVNTQADMSQLYCIAQAQSSPTPTAVSDEPALLTDPARVQAQVQGVVQHDNYSVCAMFTCFRTNYAERQGNDGV
jgi:hypothetical protein